VTDSDLDSHPNQSAPQPEKPSAPPARGHWLLITVLAAAAGAALLAAAPLGGTNAVTTAVSARPIAEPALAMGSDATVPADVIAGTVLERLDVEKYTYLRLDTGQPGGAWAAVASAKVAVGDKVRIADAQLMTAFVSATLKRTFDSIYFGTLEDGSRPPAARARQPGASLADDPHAGIPGAPSLGAWRGASGTQSPHGSDDLEATGNPHGAGNPHGMPSPAAPTIAVANVPKAEGPHGRTVAEIHAQRNALKGQPIRLRAVVVKVVTGVLGRSFVRVRDGSENAEVKDLLVTTEATPAVGARVMVEGKVVIDKDYGAGYVYPVLVEDAALKTE
jgi:hypothetical protein